MSVIRVSCPTCGDAHLNEDEITVRICNDTTEAEYRYRCPGCQLTQVKSASIVIVDLLVRYGVCVERFDLPAELEERHDHPPITHDDLLDAHFELEQL